MKKICYAHFTLKILFMRDFYIFFVTEGVYRNCKPAGDFLKLHLRPYVMKNFVYLTREFDVKHLCA